MMDSKTLIDSLSPEKRALLALRLSKKRSGSATAKPLPTIDAAPENRYRPFPLTDLQQAYWIGRTVVFEIGNIPSKAYIELECVDFDLERFTQAWQRLIDCHEMLRAIILEDGTQQILETVPTFEIEVVDVHDKGAEQVEAHLADVYEKMLYDERRTDAWPLFQVKATQLDQRRIRLHICLDLLNFDAGSIAILFKELSRLYKDPRAALDPPSLSFRDYVLAQIAFQQSEMYEKSRDYWDNRLATLPPAPELPLAKTPLSIKRPRFKRRLAHLDRESWSRLKTWAREAGLTPTGLLLTVYAEILNTWSNNSHFSINIPIFNRLPLHPQVNDIIGDFTAVNLLEVDFSTPDTFLARAQRIQQQLLADLDHRYMSGVEVLRKLAQLDRAAFGKGIPIVFTTLLEHGVSDVIDEIGKIVRSINQTAQVWMDIHVDEHADELVIKWDAVEELFPEGLIDDMLEAYHRCLTFLAESQENWHTAERQLLPPAQLEQRAAINDTAAPIPQMLLHELFQMQVSQRPNQAAVITPSRTLTYNELARFANRVGRRLRESGAKPNQLVAIVMDKGWEQVVAAQGVLHAGAAYVPIDPEFPQERVWHLLERSEVEIILTQSWIDERLAWPEGLQRFAIDVAENWAGIDDSPLEPVQLPGDLAYVLYTSGSTGLPKGVMLTHRGAVNRMTDVNQCFGIRSEDRAIGLTALQHDLSIFDIFAMLAAGGTLVLPEAALRRDPAHWAELMLKERITVWNSVPAFMEMFVEYLEYRAKSNKPLPDSLRLVMMSGDWVPVSLPNRIRAIMDEVQVISLGGPTETTTWDICYPIGEIDPAWKSIPYGRPMTNASYHILNEALEPCPTWVTGELYIGGVGLARGYWRDEEKTTAKFIIHPKTGERLYRSGDLGRYLPDGNIEFMGRADFQVQVRGQRIELGEIEATLEQHQAVRSAVVSVVGEMRSGNKQLVAYVVPVQDTQPATSDLRNYLSDKLPEHMVPSIIMLLERLPLTRNGKVDRRSLPEPVETMPEIPIDSKANGAGIIDRVVRLVTNTLKLNQAKPDANLLSLGANSIDMIRIGNQLENEFGFRPGMDQIFRLQTINALAGYIEQHLPDDRQQGANQQPGTSTNTILGINSEVASVVASFEVLLTPEEKEAFKNRQPGLRRGDDDKLSIQLTRLEHDEAFKRIYKERRSHRVFSSEPIAFEQFSKFLSSLSELTLNGKPKYQYASPGGLYPLQTYLHIKSKRVEGLEVGTYYYHPKDHRLITLSPEVELDRSIHMPFINTPTFDQAAFSIFLIAQLSAIAPSYGEYSVHFATLEAGIMAHHLEMSAPACGIGLCQIGSIDFDRIHHLFHLDESHILAHSLLGGRVESPEEISRKLGF